MNNPFAFTLSDMQFFLLVFFRVTGLVMFAPIFGSDAIPPVLKIFFSLLLAMIVFPGVSRAGIVPPDTFLGAVVAVFLEFSMGAIIGFSATLLFAAVQCGGEIIGQEIGISMANVIDPISNQQTSIIGQFKFMLAVIIYLCVDGHHFLIQSTASSFQSVPLMGLSLSDDVVMRLSDRAGTELLIDAIRISAPALLTLFLVTIAMGFLARIVPEMNIFIIGFTIRIVVGFGIVWLCLPLFGELFRKMNGASEAMIGGIIRGLSGT